MVFPLSPITLPISSPYTLREGASSVAVGKRAEVVNEEAAEGRVFMRVSFGLERKGEEEDDVREVRQARLRVTDVEKEDPADERHTSEASLSRD